jgi:hypothetical protein
MFRFKSSSNNTLPDDGNVHFLVVVGLELPKDPKSYAGGSLLLVGSPLPDRSKVMAQTKRGTLVLHVGGWAAGLTTYPWKKCLLRKLKV